MVSLPFGLLKWRINKTKEVNFPLDFMVITLITLVKVCQGKLSGGKILCCLGLLIGPYNLVKRGRCACEKDILSHLGFASRRCLGDIILRDKITHCFLGSNNKFINKFFAQSTCRSRALGIR